MAEIPNNPDRSILGGFSSLDLLTIQSKQEKVLLDKLTNGEAVTTQEFLDFCLTITKAEMALAVTPFEGHPDARHCGR